MIDSEVNTKYRGILHPSTAYYVYSWVWEIFFKLTVETQFSTLASETNLDRQTDLRSRASNVIFRNAPATKDFTWVKTSFKALKEILHC